MVPGFHFRLRLRVTVDEFIHDWLHRFDINSLARLPLQSRDLQDGWCIMPCSLLYSDSTL